VSSLVDQAVAGMASATMAAQPSGQLWLEVLDRGRKTAVVVVGPVVHGRLVALAGTRPLVVAPGERDGVLLPETASSEALVVSSSQPVLVEQDWYGFQPASGMSLSPAVRLG
jgi:hypothetical protein